MNLLRSRLLLAEGSKKDLEFPAFLPSAIDLSVGAVLGRLNMPSQCLSFQLGGVLERLQAAIGCLSRRIGLRCPLLGSLALLGQLGELGFELADQASELGRLAGRYVFGMGCGLHLVAQSGGFDGKGVTFGLKRGSLLIKGSSVSSQALKSVFMGALQRQLP